MTHKKESSIKKVDEQAIKLVNNLLMPKYYKKISLGSMSVECGIVAMKAYLKHLSFKKIPKEFAEIVRTRLVLGTLTVLCDKTEEEYRDLLKSFPQNKKRK